MGLDHMLAAFTVSSSYSRLLDAYVSQVLAECHRVSLCKLPLSARPARTRHNVRGSLASLGRAPDQLRCPITLENWKIIVKLF